MPAEQTLTTDQAAKALGISKSTLLRWIREKRIEDVKRDRNQWRIFSPDDLKRIRKAM